MRHARIAWAALAGLVAGVAMESLAASPAAPAGGTPAGVTADVKAFVAKRCLGCHDDATREAGVSLEALGDTVSDATAAGWLRALEQIERGTMPPPSEEQPTTPERRAAAVALEGSVVAHAKTVPARQTAVLRRLNRTEYRRTLEDLFHLDLSLSDPTIDFPQDERTHGFASDGEKLVTSSFLMRHYLAAAKDIVGRAIHFEERPAERTWSVHPPFGRIPSFAPPRAPYQSLDQGEGCTSLADLGDGVPLAGWYSIRVRAEAKFRHADMNAKKLAGESGFDPGQPLRLALTTASLVGIDPANKSAIYEQLGQHRKHIEGRNVGAPPLALWDVPDDVPTWLECRVWLEPGQFPKFYFENGPVSANHRIQRFIDENRYSLLDKQQLAAFEAQKPTGVEVMKTLFEYPRIRLYEVEVKGPLNEQWPPASHRAIFGDTPYQSAAAGDVLRTFAARAWRRPVAADDVAQIERFVRREEQDAVAAGTAPAKAAEDAIAKGVWAVICAPEFLYRRERGERLDGPEIASRLSYFLWSSLPDQTLLERAASGELGRPEVRRQEAERLLADPRSDAFVDEFLDGWLTLQKLGSMTPVFREWYHDRLEYAMRTETRLYFKRLLHTNGPIADLLDSDYTFVNRALAKLYGIDWQGVEPNVGRPVAGLAAADLAPDSAGSAPSQGFVLAKLPDRKRGGVLGQGSVLTLTANGVDTSPVVRGAWLLENILGAPPSPPPPNIPVIEPDVRGKTTLRQRLEKHREDPSCLSCHRHIDPPGFALESFDAIGRWRGSSKETTGGDFDGVAFKDIAEFKTALLDRQPQFARCLVEKMLVHLLGRELTAADRPAIRGILDQTAAGGYRIRDLVLACCESDLVVQK